MDDQARHSAFMSALVTEHFVLQSAASTTVSEAAGRAGLYMSALSSSLIAMGFMTQTPGLFAPFATAVIPAIVVLGIFTVVRLVDTGVQNLTYLAGMANIRGYYRTLTPDAAPYFTPWGQAAEDGEAEALALTTATPTLARRRSQLIGFFTTASMIAAVNSLVAGAGVALACVWAFGRGQAFLCVLVGLASAVGCMWAFILYQNHRYRILRARS